ncbi:MULTISPECIES: hypothetical protein [Bacillota]|jgi:hypothetical protein|uniref:Uncharacterized protein n=2 Tax=Amedibacillus TaxID=2749846 RepID=A0A7G9GPY1_9FIRM|nr:MULTISPECIES: hypothetical protein [Bacillota]QNM12863.1 hypothetical protein H9Q80_02610 [[Eubacterium] hominis]MCH4286743.1 hypothetical protein [Amedibacillus hominis]RGB58176.1 hypothetical protein DW271_00335 [Absiella sp. AM22-9]RGB59949.1 hypothetical protein DW120_09960 [Absiella sp. AM10-20]RGB66014.1 hypothetical protein DW113_10420 [Absiella sp. AM09-45]
MSEHRYILPTKNFDYIFFGLLALVGAVRLISGIHGVDLGIWFFQNIQFIFLPVFICMMLYRVNLYYQNIFIRTRYINENVWKKNYLKECMLMSAFVIFLFYFDIILCCFEATSIFFIVMLLLFVHSVTIFMILAQLNCFLYSKFKNKYVIYFIIIAICLVFSTLLRFIGNYYSVEHCIGNQPYMWYICVAGILMNVLLPFIIQYSSKMKAIQSKLLFVVIGIIIFYLQSALFRGLGGIENIGFPDVFFLSINEIIFPLCIWILGIVLLAGIPLYYMLVNYRSHLLFYAIRITNRSIWFLKVLGKGILYLMVLLCIKYAIDVYFQNANLSFLHFMMESILRMVNLALIAFLGYQMIKDIKFFSYVLIFLMIVIGFSIITNIGSSIILMRTHDMLTLISLGCCTFILIWANCYTLNHWDYY